MKITVSINNNGTVASVDFYPNEHILWIKTNGCGVQKILTRDEAMLAAQLLSKNPIGKFVDMVTAEVKGFTKCEDCRKHIGPADREWELVFPKVGGMC